MTVEYDLASLSRVTGLNVTTDDLEKVNHVVSHYNCADGTVAAMICQVALTPVCPDLKIDFMNYKSPELKNLVAAPGMMFVDFSPPFERWEEFKSAGTIVVDHHDSIKDHILGEKVIFEKDNARSGALMCFDHVLVPMFIRHKHISQYELNKWEMLARFISTYDTWNQGSPLWKDAQNITQGVLFFGIKEMMNMSKNGLDLDLIQRIGKRWNSRIYNKAHEMCKRALIHNHGGFSFAYVNNTEKLTSEIGDELGKSHDLVIIYLITVQDGVPHGIFSLRTRTSFDTTCISFSLGGGGHKESSGFTVPLDEMDLLSWFDKIESLALMRVVRDVIDS